MYCASTIRLGHAGRTSTRCELWNSAYARMNFLPIHQAMLHNLFTKYVRLCACLYVRKVIENREILSACMRVNERRWRRSSNHVQTGVHTSNTYQTALQYWFIGAIARPLKIHTFTRRRYSHIHTTFDMVFDFIFWFFWLFLSWVCHHLNWPIWCDMMFVHAFACCSCCYYCSSLK